MEIAGIVQRFPKTAGDPVIAYFGLDRKIINLSGGGTYITKDMSYILGQKPQYIVKTDHYSLDNTICCGLYYLRERMRFGKGRREAVPLNTGSSQKAGEDRSEK